MNASTVTVERRILLAKVNAALTQIQDKREQARRSVVAEKLEQMRKSWWRKLPVPTFEELYAQEKERARARADNQFHDCQFRYREHERMLGLMLTACELRNEVVLTLHDLKYLGEPIHTPIPMLLPR
jgi:hypothetical protein